MRTDRLDYPLPPGRVAQEPLAERDASLLLVLDRRTGAVVRRRFRDLPGLLAPGDLLVRNVSRVLPARLRARRPSGGRVELLLLGPAGEDAWEGLARPARRIRQGERLRLPSGRTAEVAPLPSAGAGRVLVRAEGLAEELERWGETPLPPYIRRPPRPSDRARYQTVYAREPGSVAAPTAGLHFTTELLAELRRRGVGSADVSLHVGPGTFQPVRSAELDEHALHSERFDVPAETAAAVRATRAAGRRVVAVGTTAVRALESAAAGGEVEAARGETRLFIRPGHVFRCVDALLTNFHQPRSTLLALAAAFAGTDALLAAYAQALRGEYRFLSYGDAMLVR